MARLDPIPLMVPLLHWLLMRYVDYTIRKATLS
jgi:hypothetical protein